MQSASEPPQTAPRDGRVIRGRFCWDGGQGVLAVVWSAAKRGWVDLAGTPVPADFKLESWAER